MEVNIGDHNNRLIDVEQDIDWLQSDHRTANEFVGQRLTKLGNRVQATEEDLRATQEDVRSTQGRVDTVEDTMMAMTLTLRGITETQEQIQRGWGGMLERLEHLPRSITNAVDTWASINMRRIQAETQTVTEHQLHGPSTKTWFGSITMPSQLPMRQTPPRPTASQHTMSTEASPNKLFQDYVHSSEYGQEVLQDSEISLQSMPEGLRESTVGLSDQSGSGPSVAEDVVSMEVEELPLMAGQSNPNRAALSVENEGSMQEIVREPVEGGDVSKEDEVSKEGETLSRQPEESRTQSSLDPMDVNIGISTPCPEETVTSTLAATHAEAGGEVGEGEQSAAGLVPTAPLVSNNVSIGSSFTTAPPMPFSPTIIPPTPTSSVNATGNALEIPHRSSGWRLPSSSTPPLTRS